ncbi:MAG: tetratricopeptide repeat protein [Actinobacteria bacterium]|nr:tetratricopeptide repeat protein [Actinomycetota bacterium]
MTASMAGAVDLAAVKARSEAAARAAEAPPPAAGAYVVDVDEAGFQTEVIDRSFQVPVLIDLWADWCQPCKQLSPVLERLATEAGGRWILAKVDVDANPRISQALQVQSIPTVFAVIGGQLVPGFQGALPEAQVREFVGAVLQAASEAGLPGAQPVDEAAESLGEPADEPGDPRFSEAEDALERGDYAGAAAQYKKILDAEPANAEASLALRQVALLQRIDGLDPALIARADTAPDDVSANLAAADDALANNDVDAALARLLGLLRRTTGDDRNAVRDRLIEYFDLIGSDDPRVPAARREMTSALF